MLVPFMRQGAKATFSPTTFRLPIYSLLPIILNAMLETCLDLCRHSFHTEGIEKEKGIINKSFYMYQDDPLGVSFQAQSGPLS